MPNQTPVGRDVFRPTNTDVPGPGHYDVKQNDDNPYRRYGFISRSERFRQPKEDEGPGGDGTSIARPGSSLSQMSGGRQPLARSASMTAWKNEEAKLRKELEHYKDLYDKLRLQTSKEIQTLNARLQRIENQHQDAMVERSKLQTLIASKEATIRKLEQSQDLLKQNLEKSMHSSIMVNPRTQQRMQQRQEELEKLNQRLRKVSEKEKNEKEHLLHDLELLKDERQRLKLSIKDANSIMAKLRKAHEDELCEYSKRLRRAEDQYTDELNKMQQEITRLEERAKYYSDEHGKLRVRLAVADNELEIVKEEAARKAGEAQHEVEGLKHEVTRCEEELQIARREHDGDRSEAEAREAEMRRRISELEVQVHQAEARKATIEQERGMIVRKLRIDIDTLQAKEKALLSELDAAQDAHAQAVKECNNLRARYTRELDQSQQKIISLQDELAKEVAVWDSRRQELEQKIEDLQAEYESRQKSHRQVEQQLREESAQLREELAARIREHELREEQWGEERDEIARESRHWQDLYQESETQLNEARQKLDDSVRDGDRRVQELRDEYVSFKKEHLDLVQEWRDKIKQLEIECERLRDARSELESRLEIQESVVRELELQDASKGQHIEELEDEVKEHAEARDALERRVEDLCAELDSAMETNAELDQEVDEVEADMCRYYVGLMQEQYGRHRREVATMKDQLDAQERALSAAYCTMRVLREEVQRSVLDTASLADHVLQRMVGENRQDAHDLEQRVAGRGDDSDECDSGIAAAPGGRVEELSRMMAQVMSIDAHIGADESFFMDRLADLELTHRSEVERRQILSDLENLQLTIMNQQILDATEEMQRKHQQQVSGLREQIEAEYAEKTKQRIISEARLQKQVNELTKRIKELEEERLALGAAKEHRGETDVAEIESLREQNADLAMQLETHKTAVGVELEQYEAELERINALASMYLDKLESSEKEMAELVEEVRELQQTAYEAESEKNAMAERLKWQIDWLKSNYALAYQEMNRLMTDNSQLAGHQNLRQKIRYVERLKEENIDLRREKMTLAKARDEWRSKASQLERELEAYKAVEVVRRRVGGGSGGRAWSATAAMPRPPAAQWQRFGEKKRRLRDDLGGSKGNEDDDGVAADDAQKENNSNSQNQQLSVTSKVSRLLETKPRQLLLRDDIEVDENRTTGNGR